MNKYLASLEQRALKHFYSFFSCKPIHAFLRHFLFRSNLFWFYLTYFVTVSLLGYLALIALSKTSSSTKTNPKDLDFFFTSVSATTVSSMSTVEMESFSNSQLIIIAVLMLFGGEVFTSMIGIIVRTLIRTKKSPQDTDHEMIKIDDHNLKQNSIRYLALVVLAYFLVAHILGSSLIYIYLKLSPFARKVLNSKAIELETFSVFTAVSSFANGGFVPTNENMIVFKADSGLLLVIAFQLLIGNTLYPPCLWLVVWILGKATKRREFEYLLRGNNNNNNNKINYEHWLGGRRSACLGLTVCGLILVQMVILCAMEWDSEAVAGLSSYRKLVAFWFQVINSRHAGESVFDLSTISSAVLALFVVMIAYGNVGFSAGYSCKRQLNPTSDCVDKWYGFAGKWSPVGKYILIIVMFFGRLKKFSMN